MAALTALEADLERAWRKYHVKAQIARFASGFVVALLLGLKNGAGDWTTFAPIAGSAAWTAAMEAWPQAPWKLIRARLRSAAPRQSARDAQLIVEPAAAPTAAQVYSPVTPDPKPDTPPNAPTA